MGNDTTTNIGENANNSEAVAQNDERQSHENNSSSNQMNTCGNSPDESNTAINEYLDIVKSEYEIERGKKESFENQAGIILALISALFVFVIEKININDIINLFSANLTFIIFLKIIFGICVFISLSYSLIFAVVTISTRKLDNFDVKSIDTKLLAEKRMNALARLILAYRNIILNHREINEKRAKTYKKSLCGSIVSIVSILIYLSLN